MPSQREGYPDDSSSRNAVSRTAVTGLDLTVVGVGASAGGLDVFKALLDALPPDTGMAFVFIQHLDPGSGSRLPGGGAILNEHFPNLAETTPSKS